jgi:cyanophycin synthetase
VLASFVRVALFLRVASLSRDHTRACTYRSQVVWEEADRRGIKMEQLIMFGKPTELYRAHYRGTYLYFQSIPVPDALTSAQFHLLDDKYYFKKLLKDNGISVSEAHVVMRIEEGRRVFSEMRKPVVVKPRIGTRARHTTTNIHTEVEFDAAFTLAKQICAYILLEEHYEGAVSRATVVAGKLEGFLHMLPAQVTGDGVHTIQELIDEKNRVRPDRVAEIVLDSEHTAFLTRSGYTEDTVLPADVTTDLSRRTGRFEGGATREIKDTVHPKLRAAVERAAHILNTPLVGFDIIVPDPEADPDAQRWGFLEANSLPYIDLHYFPLEGKPSNVAAAVWNMWDSQAL